MENDIKRIFFESIELKRQFLEEGSANIVAATNAIIDSIKAGGAIYVFGNGGSAADAQHIVAELVGKFYRLRQAFKAQAFTTNTSILTAWSNDVSYDTIFSRQLEAWGKKGDIAWGISTSGNSPNVVEAFKKARELGVTTIGMTGMGGGAMEELSDVLIAVPSKDTPRIQETHETIYHAVCELVEKAF